MSHKIKLDLKSSNTLEDLPNQKISISLGKKAVKNKKLSTEKKIPSPNTTKNQIKPVVLDQQLFKQFKKEAFQKIDLHGHTVDCLLYTSPSPRDRTRSRMPSSA